MNPRWGDKSKSAGIPVRAFTEHSCWLDGVRVLVQRRLAERRIFPYSGLGKGEGSDTEVVEKREGIIKSLCGFCYWSYIFQFTQNNPHIYFNIYENKMGFSACSYCLRIEPCFMKDTKLF